MSEQENLHKVIELCYQMLELADYCDYYRQNNTAAQITGTLRESAYKIRSMADKELQQLNSNEQDTF